ncbi:MAG: GNAT family N-acetyltransferase [Anaerolineales bacterium]
MVDFTLRPATENDSLLIKDLIHRVGINPMDLDWHRFVVAVDGSGKMLGCGQLKPHGRDVIELASIAVEPSYQHQGIARVIIESLIACGPRPLYLTCRSRLGSFYEKWGFRSIQPNEMPAYFRRLSRLVNVIGAFIDDKMLVMKLM